MLAQCVCSVKRVNYLDHYFFFKTGTLNQQKWGCRLSRFRLTSSHMRHVVITDCRKLKTTGCGIVAFLHPVL